MDADGVYRKTGPARVFLTEPAAIAAIKSEGTDRVKPGDVMVLICRGPMGAGMEEILQITAALKHLAFGKHVAVLTDARFSGVSTGACIGHVTPEALAGGPIGKVRDGDLIEIVIDRNKLEGTRRPGGRGWARCSAPKKARACWPGRPAQRLGAGPGPAGRHAPVGGLAGRQRRHLGRLRVRYREDRPGAGGGRVGSAPGGAS